MSMKTEYEKYKKSISSIKIQYKKYTRKYAEKKIKKLQLFIQTYTVLLLSINLSYSL